MALWKSPLNRNSAGTASCDSLEPAALPAQSRLSTYGQWLCSKNNEAQPAVRHAVRDAEWTTRLRLGAPLAAAKSLARADNQKACHQAEQPA